MPIMICIPMNVAIVISLLMLIETPDVLALYKLVLSTAIFSVSSVQIF